MGRLANLTIEYMVALKFKDMVPDCQISNITIPGWGIHHPSIDSLGLTAVEEREQHIDLPSLAGQMLSGRIARVEWCGFGQRLENFLPVDRYWDVFVSPFEKPMGYGPEYLVCPIRAEDILDGPNPNYTLIPVEFYRDVVAMTGLNPVFIGQTEPNAYMDRIRAAFPNALYREPRTDPLVDFETIRQSRNMLVSISTYSWLAAWLSRSLENIYMPVNGLFNPRQFPQVDLLPFGDARFKFFLFPINYALPSANHAELHRRIAPYWRLVPHGQLRRLIEQAPRFHRTVDTMLEIFDEDFYLTVNEDVAAIAQIQGQDFARAHYIMHGFNEGRSPMRLDRQWYAHQYPMAGFEVAQGDYLDFLHHYAAAGRARGYLPYPPEAGS